VDDVPWKPFIGTAAHEQFAAHPRPARGRAGARHRAAVACGGNVTVGHVMGVPVVGTCDVFDAYCGVVADWKFTTRNKIKTTYRPKAPATSTASRRTCTGEAGSRPATTCAP